MATTKAAKDVKKIVETPQINHYKVLRDGRAVGFKVALAWDFLDEANLVGFKVFRAKVSTSLLQKTYNVSQAALEKLTAIKSFPPIGNILYNKFLFSENSKVKIHAATPSRFEKKEESVSSLEYSEIGFVRNNKRGVYEFNDKNIKFGQTYSYVIVALNNSLFQSPRSKPVFVNIEDIEHPDAPRAITISETPEGILIVINTTSDNDISAFDIFKRLDGEENFNHLIRVKSDFEFVSFVDTQLVPGRTYEYKIYSVDFFDNISYSAPRHKITFGSFVSRRQGLPNPSIDISVQSGEVILTGYKNNPNVAGYRIERRDRWRREKSYSIKKANEISWPNVILFEGDKLVLVDKTAILGKNFQYRITSISKTGHAATYLAPPVFTVENGFHYSNVVEKKKPNEKTANFNHFTAEVLDDKQDPVFVKFSWDISGEWGYAIIEGDNFKMIVDDIHKVAFTNLLRSGANYVLTMKLYDLDDNFIIASEKVSINL